MSDESSGDDLAGTPPVGLHPEDTDILRDLAGCIDPVRPIGPLALRFRTRRPYILVAVAVTALLGGAGAALVVTGTGKPAAAANASAPGPSRVLHGQYVVRDPDGGYQTVDEQAGQVVAVSSSSITLRSIDGFTQSYVVSRSTAVDSGRARITAVKVGDQASVLATLSGSTAAATVINDQTLLQHRGSTLGSGRVTSGASAAGAG